MTYNLGTGIWKTLKNGVIFWLPALVAFLSNVPQEYAVAAGFVLYLLKNYAENK
jgi:hypothetical protein